MSDIKSVLFVGVGGQGTILASKILTIGLIGHGYDVKMSEVHGMSQRGGSVSTQVRFGSQVYSPIIGEGSADILVSFEEMEAARPFRRLPVSPGDRGRIEETRARLGFRCDEGRCHRRKRRTD
ncbi:2-oxoacid:acceptor oxidoreductase family protein [Megasphaera elsdenii]|uniref:2-oxoacid:acceptor oxidoreductase family protein n=1 Tax=Megasphaera elsdenii TaxID=907 RepID=UPI003D047957